MNRILIISSCQRRGNSIGIVGDLISDLKRFDRDSREINLFDISFFTEEHDPALYSVDNYFSIPRTRIGKIIKIIPRIRALYLQKIVENGLESILAKQPIDNIIIYQIPPYTYRLIRIAHKYSAKVILFPWGGDILRVSRVVKNKINKAMALSDYVVAINNSNCAIEAVDTYHVIPQKIRNPRPVLNGVQAIDHVDKNKSRHEMSIELGIPDSNTNIVCGYSGEETQRHMAMIDAIAQNISILPSDTQLLFPVTYCASPQYIESLKKTCTTKGLQAIFFTDYLSNEQMAYLHLITDLFIQIQPWDNGSAFMIEALYCKNQIVTGRWLKYKQFEQFGQPYHLIDKTEDLPDMIKRIFSGEAEKIVVPQKLVDIYTIPAGFKMGSFWKELFDEII